MSQQPPPPPPPPGGYGAPPPPPAGGQPWSVGNAVNYGWTKFQANAGQIVIAGVVLFVGIVVFEIIGFVIRGALVSDPECHWIYRDGVPDRLSCSDGSGFIVSLLASAIMTLLFFVVFQIIGAGIIRGALGITEGRPFVFSEIFKTEKIGAVIVTSLITSAIIFVGMLLCFLPGIVAAFFLSYAMFFVIDKDMAPMEAISASFNLVKDRVGEALVWALISYLIIIAGAILLGVGLIVAVPVSLIGTAFTYKLLTGQPVAP